MRHCDFLTAFPKNPEEQCGHSMRIKQLAWPHFSVFFQLKFSGVFRSSSFFHDVSEMLESTHKGLWCFSCYFNQKYWNRYLKGRLIRTFGEQFLHGLSAKQNQKWCDGVKSFLFRPIQRRIFFKLRMSFQPCSLTRGKATRTEMCWIFSLLTYEIQINF